MPQSQARAGRVGLGPLKNVRTSKMATKPTMGFQVHFAHPSRCVIVKSWSPGALRETPPTRCSSACRGAKLPKAILEPGTLIKPLIDRKAGTAGNTKVSCSEDQLESTGRRGVLIGDAFGLLGSFLRTLVCWRLDASSGRHLRFGCVNGQTRSFLLSGLPKQGG